jgi:hypothetical protein
MKWGFASNQPWLYRTIASHKHHHYKRIFIATHFFTKLIPPNISISCNAMGCILALGFTGLITYVLYVE